MLNEMITARLAEEVIFSTPYLYGICYNNGTDKRLLINHGIFLTEEDCINYISSLKSTEIFEPFPIKRNNYDYSASFITIQDEISYTMKPFIEQISFMESIQCKLIESIIKDIEKLSDMNDGLLILETIAKKYNLDFEDLKILIEEEYNELINKKSVQM